MQYNCYGNKLHILTLYLKVGLNIFCGCVGGKTQALEGQPPKGIVVIAFDRTENALAWYNSPAYEAIKPIRQGAAVSRMFIAEGLPPQ